MQCKGDSSSYQIGNYIGNEIFLRVRLLFTDVHGCDSIINVRLNYFANTSYTFADTVCAESGFIFSADRKSTASPSPQGLPTSKCFGLHSAIHVNIPFTSTRDSTTLADTICYHDSLLYNNEYLFPDQKYKFRYPSKNPCDSIVTIFWNPNKPDYEFGKPHRPWPYGGHQFQNKADEPWNWMAKWPRTELPHLPQSLAQTGPNFFRVVPGKLSMAFGAIIHLALKGYPAWSRPAQYHIYCQPGVESEFRWITRKFPGQNFTMRIYDGWIFMFIATMLILWFRLNVIEFPGWSAYYSSG